MRTTIAIDEELVDELMRVEPGVSRSEAIRRAIQDYLRRKRVDAFMKLAGSRLVDLDWRKAEHQELEEVQQMDALTNRRRDVRKR
jgi:metal-responsive CopG/Arc/MetJ family transcriptional regulator